jgi:hypothetical protein
MKAADKSVRTYQWIGEWQAGRRLGNWVAWRHRSGGYSISWCPEGYQITPMAVRWSKRYHAHNYQQAAHNILMRKPSRFEEPFNWEQYASPAAYLDHLKI